MCSVMTNGRVSSPNNPKSLRSSIRNNSEEMSDSESNPPSPKTGNNNLRENDEELSVESPERFEENDNDNDNDDTDVNEENDRSSDHVRFKSDKDSEGNDSHDNSDEDERPLDFTTGKSGHENNNGANDGDQENGEEYFSPFKKLEMKSPLAQPPFLYKPIATLPPPPPLLKRGGPEDDSRGSQSQKRRRGLQSFSIDEILSHKAASLAAKAASKEANDPHHPQAIVRPWDIETATTAVKNSLSSSEMRRKSMEDSPLDALFQMASKTFEGLKAKSDLDPSQLSFASKQPPKKKRKSRTAFTNHQIFELEKRFLYQKYLSPADRDEIAAQLGLTNAQVITWFQNRRAKLKRDMEELRKDVECTSQVIPHALGHQQMAAAAVAALASRRLQGPPGIKFPMDLHRSPPPSHMFQHGLLTMQPPGSNSSSHESLASPNSPLARSDRSDRSPQIRVTDSD